MNVIMNVMRIKSLSQILVRFLFRIQMGEIRGDLRLMVALMCQRGTGLKTFE
jgi:hypothetical protein